MAYRPRSALVRSVYNKYLADASMKDFDHSLWYNVNELFLPGCLRATYVQSSVDAETQLFLNSSTEKSDQIFTQLWYLFAKTILQLFISQTSINGLLRRGSMFVFSWQQFYKVTGLTEVRSSPRRLLDLGAGDGNVTSVISHFFDEVYVTEVSKPMQWILQNRGYKLLDIAEWSEQQALKFDVISCLNLLDRCDRPLDILQDMKKVLSPGGIVVLALVLPFKPYVETGRADHTPTQSLNIFGDRFEDQVNSLVHSVINPAGYSVVRWTRLPYLCEGDIEQAYYWLDDVVVVLTPDDPT